MKNHHKADDRHIGEQRDTRYYAKFYAGIDDSCIVDTFGNRTKKVQHRNIYKQYYPCFGKNEAFLHFQQI